MSGLFFMMSRLSAKRLDLPDEIRQISLHNLPDNFKVDAEIFMYQKITKVFDILPSKIG